MSIRCLIADEDPAMRDVLVRIIARAPSFELVGEAQDGIETVALFEKLRPQAVLLDVEMPGQTGVECAKQIQDMAPKTIIIFATAHEQYMKEAFEVYAFDYLVKPFSVERALQTFERVAQRLQESHSASLPLQSVANSNPRKMMIKHKEGVHFINEADILLVQREDRATVIYTAGEGRYVLSEPLSAMEERLNIEHFMRCHKSYIININSIKNIYPYGRWTYIVKLNGIKQDALMTAEKYQELEQRYGK